MRKLAGHGPHQANAVAFSSETPDVLLDMPFGPAAPIVTDHEDIFLFTHPHQPFPVETVTHVKQRIAINESTYVSLVLGMQSFEGFERYLDPFRRFSLK